VIHIHGLGYHTFAAVVAGRLADRPTLTKLASSGPHSDILRMRNDQRLALSRHMLPGALRSDRFVALNSAVVDELAAAGVDRNRVVAISNGVDTATFVPRDDFKLREPARILFVGRLDPQKGLDTLIRASHLLRRTADTTVKLQLLGEGPSRNELMDLVESLGLEPDVEFVGKNPDVRRYLEQADIFVLPSRAEGMSNALLEAMSCGLPVVATRIPGNLELVEDQVNGLLCNVDDEESLANSLATLMEDASLRGRLGRAARRKVEASHSLKSVAEQYADLYRQLILGRIGLPDRSRPCGPRPERS